MRFFLFYALIGFLFGGMGTVLWASTGDSEADLTEPQISGSVELPVWEDGEPRESFDIRIWPEAVIVWLEWENLRSLIEDPDTPGDEREALRQVLAHQKAWWKASGKEDLIESDDS